MSNFQKYSAFYDLLYQDKDYDAEAAYVARTLRGADPAVRTVLELGSGTGKHGRLMARMGFDIHGIELSDEMVAIAQASDETCAPGSFTCQSGDIRDVAMGRTYDAVISLFHVISYQTTNDALREAFAVAADHLKPGGIFLFDVWHGPAVLTERPAPRTKEASDARRKIIRKTTPHLDAEKGTVNVVFDMDCRDLDTGETAVFREEHLMRYLFPTEIEFLARSAGLDIIATEEFLTGATPASTTWGVAYCLKKPMSEPHNV